MPQGKVDLTLVGNLYARAWFTNVVLSVLLLGVQSFICIYVLIVFLETPEAARKGRWPYIVIMFLAFLLSAVPISMDAAYLFISLFESTSPTDFLNSGSAGSKYFWLRVPAQTIPTRLLMFLGDGLLLYRCYIVCDGDRRLIALPTLIFFAIVPVGIVTMTHASSNTFIFSCILLSVVLNVMVTAIISTRLLIARRQFLRALPESSSAGIGGRYTGVVAILIEAAAPLSVFGLVYAIAAAVATYMDADMNKLRTDMAVFFFEVLYYSFTALSPQLIIFRVTMGRSWVQRPSAKSGRTHNSEVLSGLVFAGEVDAGNPKQPSLEQDTRLQKV